MKTVLYDLWPEKLRKNVHRSSMMLKSLYDQRSKMIAVIFRALQSTLFSINNIILDGVSQGSVLTLYVEDRNSLIFEADVPIITQPSWIKLRLLTYRLQGGLSVAWYYPRIVPGRFYILGLITSCGKMWCNASRFQKCPIKSTSIDGSLVFWLPANGFQPLQKR